MQVNRKRMTHRKSYRPGHVSPRSMYAIRASVPAPMRQTLKMYRVMSPRTRAEKKFNAQEAARQEEKRRQEHRFKLSMKRASVAAANAAEKHAKKMRILQQRIERDTRADRLPEMRAKAESAQALMRVKKGALGMQGMADELMAAVVDHNYDAVIAMLSGLSVHNGPSHAASAAVYAHHNIRWNNSQE